MHKASRFRPSVRSMQMTFPRVLSQARYDERCHVQRLYIC